MLSAKDILAGKVSLKSEPIKIPEFKDGSTPDVEPVEAIKAVKAGKDGEGGVIGQKAKPGKKGKDGGYSIKQWSGVERDEFEATCSERVAASKDSGARVDSLGVKALVVVLSLVVSKTGKLVFEVSDAQRLNGLVPGGVIDRIYQAVQRLNHLTDADVEELAGNSDADPSD